MCLMMLKHFTKRQNFRLVQNESICRRNSKRGGGGVLQTKYYSGACVNPFPNKPFFFTFLHYKSFENNVEKGEIARNEQFLLFPQFFQPVLRTLPFSSNLTLSSASYFSLEESKIYLLGKKGLKKTL